LIYLDHNASSPLLPAAREAWLEAAERFPGNPSSPHRSGARAEYALEDARHRLAARLGCRNTDLIWTSGATEGCATAIHHAGQAAGPGAVAWVSAIEHPAVHENARRFFAGRIEKIPVDARGVVEVGWLREQRRRESPALVAVMAANNETGVLQPWREVRDWCIAERIPFFCDATQVCGRMPVDGLGACDLAAGSAHKFGGPRGVGFLKVPATGDFHALVHGGKQAEGRRAGTENVTGVLAMIAALEWCEARIAAGEAAGHAAWRDSFEAAVTAALPGTRVVGAGAPRLWNTSSLLLPAADCRQRWVVRLDKAGFAVSTGSACASGSEEPSHVLTAMGVSASEAGRAVRVSAGWSTTEAEWTALRDAMGKVWAASRATDGSGEGESR